MEGMKERTCPQRHFCERAEFLRKREVYDTKVYKESRYEVWDTQANLNPEWDGLESEEVVFDSDDQGEVDAYLAQISAQTGHRYEVRENGVCKVCDMYEARKEALARGRVLPYYLVVVGTSRHYGGPEEGGWWYDMDSIVEVRRAFTLEEGLRQYRELREEHPQPRFNRFSCANRGEPDTRIVLCYGEQDPRWPQETKERPRYE